MLGGEYSDTYLPFITITGLLYFIRVLKIFFSLPSIVFTHYIFSGIYPHFYRPCLSTIRFMYRRTLNWNFIFYCINADNRLIIESLTYAPRSKSCSFIIALIFHFQNEQIVVKTLIDSIKMSLRFMGKYFIQIKLYI